MLDVNTLQVFRHGVMAGEVTDIADLWPNSSTQLMVAFLLGEYWFRHIVELPSAERRYAKRSVHVV